MSAKQKKKCSSMKHMHLVYVKYECLFEFLTYIQHIKCHISIPVMQSKWYFNRNQGKLWQRDSSWCNASEKSTIFFHWRMNLNGVRCCCFVCFWFVGATRRCWWVIGEILGVFVAKPLNRHFIMNEMSISPFNIESPTFNVQKKRARRNLFEEKN